MSSQLLQASWPARWHALVYMSVAVALLAGSVLVAQDYGNNKPPPVSKETVPITAEQMQALHALDVRIGGVESLLPKIDDAKFKASVVASIADFRRRRAALEKRFDPATYDTLMHAVIGRYQVVALWLKPPRVPAGT